jgi:thiol-disulfide isomerase/thioredoxin
MKKILFAVIATTLFTTVYAQTPYTSVKDEKHPEGVVLNGIISKYILENDPVFNWYASSRSSYTPPTEVLNAMESAKSRVQFLIFGGTWCEDTQFILPKFFKLQELSGFPDASISFFGVNRAKKTLGNVAEVFKIVNVPTIIVMKDGKETGRVVEYGKTGKWDVELAEFLR